MEQTPEQVYETLRAHALEEAPGLVGDPGPDHPDVLGAVHGVISALRGITPATGDGRD